MANIRMGAVDYVLGGTSTVLALLKDVARLIPNAGPLVYILGVTKEQ
jgi:hypothetical protein